MKHRPARAYDEAMTADTSTETTASANGTAPAPPADPCDDCATRGEKTLAVVAALFGVFVILMAVDMFSGGKVSGYVAAARE
jgi:hypothetical protein